MPSGRMISIVAGGLVLATAGLAHAYPVTMQMGGEITASSDPSLTGINVGDTWNFVYVFDSAAVDQDPTEGYGQYDEDWINFTVNGQPLAVNQSPYQVGIINHVNYDIYRVEAFFSPFGGFEGNWPALHIYLNDLDSSVFADDSLPLTPLPLSEFESIQFEIQDMLNGGDMAEGTLTYWTPEPASLLLLALGGLTLTRRPNP